MTQIRKKVYTSPSLQVCIVEFEEGIAAGSAIIRSEDINNQVKEEWEQDPDDSRTFNW